MLKTEHVAQAFAAIRKAGTVVVTGIGNVDETTIPVPAFELTLYQKRIQGALFGASSPSRDIPWMLQHVPERPAQARRADHHDRTRSTRSTQGYADMHAGKNIRGVINF